VFIAVTIVAFNQLSGPTSAAESPGAELRRAAEHSLASSGFVMRLHVKSPKVDRTDTYVFNKPGRQKFDSPGSEVFGEQIRIRSRLYLEAHPGSGTFIVHNYPPHTAFESTVPLRAMREATQAKKVERTITFLLPRGSGLLDGRDSPEVGTAMIRNGRIAVVVLMKATPAQAGSMRFTYTKYGHAPSVRKPSAVVTSQP
jgi:hypothetical protein